MNAKDAIKYVLVSNQNILEMFLADLGDEDLLVRPVPGANHVAWQLGHLITSEVKLIADMGCATAKLPAGFAEKHTKLTAANDSPTAFLKKAEYMAVFKTVHEGTLAALEKLSETDLDKPTTGPMKDFAPTVGAMFLMVGSHTMMHAGQFTALRRKQGKPVVF